MCLEPSSYIIFFRVCSASLALPGFVAYAQGGHAQDPSLCKVRSAIVSSILSESTFCILAAATHEEGAGVVLGPLRDAAVGEACRAAFARDELSEDDDETARLLYAGEAREMAKTLIEHKNSKSARRFERLREELSSRTAGRDL